ncbi:unnamed protein product [Echinostoma caproni]|uniref:BHLH domain-containing protein n=1 Tax=Echinostoma caproni TaxID=27848 RepID=A0A183A818_9TREM|nr:unnamed protein product [Echinostoma caproni]
MPPFVRILNQYHAEVDQENLPIRQTNKIVTNESRRPALTTLSRNVSDQPRPTFRDGTARGKLKPQSVGTVRVSRRNERERNRVRLINMGFERLRAVVPCQSGEQLSKISTLRKAIWYIEHLDRVLHESSSTSDNRDGWTDSSGSATITSTAATTTKTDDDCSVEDVTIGTTSARVGSVVSGSLKSVRLSASKVQHSQLEHIQSQTQREQQRDFSLKQILDEDGSGSRSGTHGAVRMASWSYPFNTPTGPYGAIGSRGRSVNSEMMTLISPISAVSEVLSPIFPPQWTQSGVDFTSTPTGFINHTLVNSGSADINICDSGYSSITLSSSELTPRQMTERRWGQMMKSSCEEGFSPSIHCSSSWDRNRPQLFPPSTMVSTFPFTSWLGRLDT